ncbi:hypothetical protein [Bacillus sp. FJAT-28004]|nr:hypothetical protein [Bacillus sp. FJAT-28004]
MTFAIGLQPWTIRDIDFFGSLEKACRRPLFDSITTSFRNLKSMGVVV